MLAVDVEREDASGYISEGVKAPGFPSTIDLRRTCPKALQPQVIAIAAPTTSSSSSLTAGSSPRPSHRSAPRPPQYHAQPPPVSFAVLGFTGRALVKDLPAHGIALGKRRSGCYSGGFGLR
jgi:hypothetical protein